MPITLDDISRFTEGDCHILAKRLHRVGGLTLHSFDFNGALDMHVFNMWNGYALDVEGLHDPAAFGYAWKIGTTIPKISRPLTPHEINTEWENMKPCYGHYSYRRARQVADMLLEKYCR
jgi:hypothetical protein